MKKGFTLIELLAVIVILAVIALILIPTVNRVIENSKYQVALTSVRGYIESVNNSASLKLVDNVNGLADGNYETGINDEVLSKVKINGKEPNYVYVEVENGEVVYGNFCINDYSIDYENGKAVMGLDNYCSNKPLAPGLYDNKNNLLASWNDLVNKYGMDINWAETVGVTGCAYRSYGENSWYCFTEEEEPAKVDSISNITSSQPAVVLAKFENADKLVIDGSIEKIPTNAFIGMKNINKVVIGEGITEIGVESFMNYNFIFLQEYSFDALENYQDADISGISSIKIPSTLEKIGEMAFAGNKISRLSLPDTVIEIDDAAFSLNRIKTLKLSSGLTTVASNAFFINYIDKLIIPEGVETIGDTAFAINPIKQIYLPSSLTNIDIAGILSTSKIDTINVDESNIKYKSDHNSLIDKTNNNLLLGSKDGYIPDYVTGIASNAFAGQGLTGITLPNGLISIANGAFNSNNIKDVVIPASVKSIESNAFYKNPLHSVTFMNTTSWGGYQVTSISSDGVSTSTYVNNIDVSNPSNNIVYFDSNKWSSLSRTD